MIFDKNDPCIELSYAQKKDIIKSHKIDKEVYEFLHNILANLNIRIGEYYKGNIMDLMEDKHLEGWCWESTESAILFFKDYDYIERGYLCLEASETDYYHSWIRFKLKGLEYIFDPCQNIICSLEDFQKLFKPRVKGCASAKIVRQEFIKQVKEYVPPDEDYDSKKGIFKFFYIDPGDEYIKYQKEKNKEVKLTAKNDEPYQPLFRNTAGYKSVIENEEIKEVDAHYYCIRR